VTATIDTYAALADRVRALPPRCGAVRVVAVDGGAGSGKTTFAERLAAALDGAPVVHTDDLLLTGWASITGFWDNLQGLLDALATGRRGSYRRYDWMAGQPAERVEVDVVPVLVVEGVTVSAATRGRHVLAVTVEAPRGLRLTRGLARDGEDMRPEWLHWLAQEDAFFADPAHARADVRVDGAPDLPHDTHRCFLRLG